MASAQQPFFGGGCHSYPQHTAAALSQAERDVMLEPSDLG